jgi:hypothetical protein
MLNFRFSQKANERNLKKVGKTTVNPKESSMAVTMWWKGPQKHTKHPVFKFLKNFLNLSMITYCTFKLEIKILKYQSFRGVK